MAKRKRAQKISPAEFRLMGILWQRGPLTLAEVYELQPGQAAYTTIQTQLNRLVVKRVVTCSKTRPMKYRAAVNPDEAAATVLQTMVASVGGGSIFPLVAQLVSSADLSKSEVVELKRLIDNISRTRKNLSMPAKKPSRKKS